MMKLAIVLTLKAQARNIPLLESDSIDPSYNVTLFSGGGGGCVVPIPR